MDHLTAAADLVRDLESKLQRAETDNDQLRATLARVTELPQSWDDSVDWSAGRTSYADNAVYTECAMELREALARTR